ncbi:MAG: tetraacyldisaccharide 4'-kinase [Paludibacteraceae bacterium]|nr:tetraacyldisaccharide 4'-kinase [Paludibacteraceae bacterium]
MRNNLPNTSPILFPLSILYRMGVNFRNWMFDSNILKSKKYDLPIISIGNITVGGTGKTPHTEYILSLLSPFMRVAMLSRGYKRKTKGFVLADKKSNSQTIGDEPFQIKKKFKDVVVAVDGDRCRGIESLLSGVHGKELGAIVLDDAYQHRYVEPGINILLTDFNRLITNDSLLPVGRLREPASNKKRANIVIVTKCPDTLKPIDIRVLSKELNLLPYQHLYFTRYIYNDFIPVFNEAKGNIVTKNLLLKETYDILLVTGIVSQNDLALRLMKYANQLKSIEYPDHHNFTQKDLQEIEIQFLSMENKNKIIITTEKDASRLMSNPNVSDTLKKSLFYIPIKVKFLFGEDKNFNEQILGYVRKNKTNSRLFKKEVAGHS